MSWYCCNIFVCLLSVAIISSVWPRLWVGNLMCCVMLNASRMSHRAFASVSSSLLRWIIISPSIIRLLWLDTTSVSSSVKLSVKMLFVIPCCVPTGGCLTPSNVHRVEPDWMFQIQLSKLLYFVCVAILILCLV